MTVACQNGRALKRLEFLLRCSVIQEISARQHIGYRLGLAHIPPPARISRNRRGLSIFPAAAERHGDVQDVVFPCGYTIASDGDTINLYYGSADSSIALAHGSVRSLLNWLDANGHSDEQHDRRHK
jgi:predicted GH43/DUF377 family glycosyl hydrolase